MSRTRRTIGVGAFIVFAALGTGWGLEKASNNSHARDAAVVEPARASGVVTAPLAPTPSNESVGGRPVTTDSSQEYDRSDLFLSQG
jgi:hypothetical protein